MSKPLNIFGFAMKIKLRLHKIMRLCALALMPLLSLADVAAGHFSPANLCLNLWCAMQLLMLYPAPHEDPHPSIAAILCSLALTLALKIVGAPVWLFVGGGSVLVFCFALHRSVCRFADIPPLFMVSTVWSGTLDYLTLLHMSAYLFTGAWLGILVRWPVSSWSMLGVLTGFFVIQYYRIYTRSTVFLGRKKERLIKQGQRGSGYRMPVQYVDSESKSAMLFNEVVRIMETRKPYLQDDFDLDDLSRMTRTNRLYLSKSINFHSGRNFNQLVNYYRVKYAVELMKRDSGLRMSDIASMSGFHTTVSFNMAFKLNEHTTPSEFARSLKKLT